ncbi:MazG nucleotide pyrophosphohydrolase domain-containing protein [Corynebacterium sp. YSMAA1_1_F7]|uniref:MazG nucleotide pyrophosphohydrolase domain-containing protein n=1 Tax=Corynebacterium sp. YSMAA1_1_F7 TaxID=3383590 RepID=UPI0038D17768
MSVVLLDPRFPAMIPVDAVDLLREDVCYTEEVPIRVRWVIADLGGHTVDESSIIVTTDLENESVIERIQAGEEVITAPSLKVHMEPARELEAGGSSSLVDDAPTGEDDREITHSGDGVVDGEIVGTDEHTAAVAGLRRTTRTEVPASVMDEIEDAVALMARALRQGEWEQAMTHTSLVKFLREETEELARTIDLMESWEPAAEDGAAAGAEDAAEDTVGEGAAAPARPEWIEQDLCSELSDVLLQVLFHAEIANRRGAFDIGHVAGAFSAKLRSRAPYLFEEVERQVPRQEQDRLWEAGKKQEEAQRVRTFGDDYLRYLDAKKQADKQSEPQAQKQAAAHESAAQAPASPRQEPHAQQFPAVHAPGEASAASTTSASQTVAGGATSALSAAEAVISEARAQGIPDTEIPTDIRYPMVGLELDSPGEAERRLHDAVAAFREKLRAQNN